MRRGFTLIELMVVILIMGLMFTFVMPQIQGFRQAALKSQARRLAGRATYLYDEATGHKLVLRLIFDMDNNGYATAQLDPYAVKPVFAPDNTHAGSAGRAARRNSDSRRDDRRRRHR